VERGIKKLVRLAAKQKSEIPSPVQDFSADTITLSYAVIMPRPSLSPARVVSRRAFNAESIQTSNVWELGSKHFWSNHGHLLLTLLLLSRLEEVTSQLNAIQRSLEYQIPPPSRDPTRAVTTPTSTSLAAGVYSPPSGSDLNSFEFYRYSDSSDIPYAAALPGHSALEASQIQDLFAQ
jgi:hypothetical protein